MLNSARLWVCLMAAWFVCAGVAGASADEARSATRPSTAASVTVAIDNFSFQPRELTVAAGTTVTWVNHDDVPHTATAVGDSPAFDSKALDTDDKYSFFFKTPGKYAYYCKVHPHMTGLVIVK